MLKVCVIFGGTNSEYEISLRSAQSVLKNLDKAKYEIIMLGITKTGKWLCYTGPAELITNGTWEFSSFTRPAVFSTDRTRPGLILLEAEAESASSALRKRIMGGTPVCCSKNEILKIDVAFPVLHGKNGEDGTMQGLLELAGIPCVGCGVLSSAMCMDKEISHIVLQAAGIPKTKLYAVHKDETELFDQKALFLEIELDYPMFVKPANAGSSVGISKVRDRKALQEAILLALEHDHKVVVEKAMTGKEVECAVLGNRSPIAAANLAEIEPGNEFYDYAAKYIDGTTNLIIPARISEESARLVRELAVRAYRALECRGMARVDFFVHDDGSATLNEINTIPGFTSISMYPRMFTESELTYSGLLDRLIASAMEG